MAESAGHAPARAPSRRAAYWALGLLTAINLLNYLDRYVIAPLGTDLKRDMALSDTQLGWLIPAFILVYMVAAPVFGAWGDRGSRTRPIALGIGIWSVATVLSGLAHGYPHLLAARALVGVGEAAIVAIAPALLGDLFAPRLRARVFALFNMAIPVGAALGYVVGDQVGAALRLARGVLCRRRTGRGAGARVAVAARSAARHPGWSTAQDAVRGGDAGRRPCTATCCGADRTWCWCSATRPTPSRSAAWPTGCRYSSSACATYPTPAPPSA